ncbi:MAG: hypothetical protein DRQ48_00305 [Gammaproteobacteria bacterium]|nr:MAG: hypothetical protein DRQ48_00305 [Gammaproteobacteria bacterium]
MFTLTPTQARAITRFSDQPQALTLDRAEAKALLARMGQVIDRAANALDTTLFLGEIADADYDRNILKSMRGLEARLINALDRSKS